MPLQNAGDSFVKSCLYEAVSYKRGLPTCKREEADVSDICKLR
jgi:hypothetical protein